MTLVVCPFNTLPHTSFSLTCCISIIFFSFEYFDSFDHYAACWVTLRVSCSTDTESVITKAVSHWGVRRHFSQSEHRNLFT